MVARWLLGVLVNIWFQSTGHVTQFNIGDREGWSKQLLSPTCPAAASRQPIKTWGSCSHRWLSVLRAGGEQRKRMVLVRLRVSIKWDSAARDTATTEGHLGPGGPTGAHCSLKSPCPPLKRAQDSVLPCLPQPPPHHLLASPYGGPLPLKGGRRAGSAPPGPGERGQSCSLLSPLSRSPLNLEKRE